MLCFKELDDIDLELSDSIVIRHITHVGHPQQGRVKNGAPVQKAQSILIMLHQLDGYELYLLINLGIRFFCTVNLLKHNSYQICCEWSDLEITAFFVKIFLLT